MKIKLDFVTNSSSTSFVYVSDRELSEAMFLRAAGVDPDGPVGELFSQMYSELRDSINSGKRLTSAADIEQLAAKHDFTPAVIEKIRCAVDAGKMVVSGSLSSDESFAESILCMTIFEMETDSFYVNAYNNYW